MRDRCFLLLTVSSLVKKRSTCPLHCLRLGEKHIEIRPAPLKKMPCEDSVIEHSHCKALGINYLFSFLVKNKKLKLKNWKERTRAVSVLLFSTHFIVTVTFRINPRIRTYFTDTSTWLNKEEGKNEKKQKQYFSRKPTSFSWQPERSSCISLYDNDSHCFCMEYLLPYVTLVVNICVTNNRTNYGQLLRRLRFRVCLLRRWLNFDRLLYFHFLF